MVDLDAERRDEAVEWAGPSGMPPPVSMPPPVVVGGSPPDWVVALVATVVGVGVWVFVWLPLLFAIVVWVGLARWDGAWG